MPVLGLERHALATSTVALLETKPYPVFFKGDNSGCGYYRCEHPAKLLGGETSTNLRFNRRAIDGSIGAYRGLGTPTIFQRPAAPHVGKAIADIVKAGGKVIVELDDDVWSISYHNPASASWGRTETSVLAQACRDATAVTVSTAPLAQVVRRFAKDVHVIPNAIDPELLPASTPREHDGLLHIGWAGSWTHKSDLALIVPALFRAARKYENVRVHFFGYDPCTNDTDQRTGERFYDDVSYTYHGWAVDMATHYRNIALLDIALAPVLDTTFNQSKSNIKYLEHASLGTAMICSKVRCYTDTVTHGRDGLLAGSAREFNAYLDLLIRDQSLRYTMAMEGKALVMERHLLPHRLEDWALALSS